jgi:hypothetical protein
MENREAIVRKVKNLLARAKGTNFEHEAGVCLNLARDLLAKYNLSMSEVETRQYQEANPEEIKLEDSAGHWQMPLAMVIAKYCNCVAFGRDGKTLYFLGMKHELEICHFTFGTVAQQIDKMLRRKRRELRDQREALGIGRQNRRDSAQYTRGYAKGVIDYLNEALNKRVQAENTCTDLVIFSMHPKVQAFKDRLKYVRSTTRITASSRGYADGLADGPKVQVHKAVK